MTTEAKTTDEGQQTKDAKVDGDAVRNAFARVGQGTTETKTTVHKTQDDRRKTTDAPASAPSAKPSPVGGRKPNKPYRQVTTLSPETHDWLEERARQMDQATPRGPDGRPVAMNHIIRALLERMRSQKALDAQIERDVQAQRAAGELV